MNFFNRRLKFLSVHFNYGRLKEGISPFRSHSHHIELLSGLRQAREKSILMKSISLVAAYLIITRKFVTYPVQPCLPRTACFDRTYIVLYKHD